MAWCKRKWLPVFLIVLFYFKNFSGSRVFCTSLRHTGHEAPWRPRYPHSVHITECGYRSAVARVAARRERRVQNFACSVCRGSHQSRFTIPARVGLASGCLQAAIMSVHPCRIPLPMPLRPGSCSASPLSRLAEEAGWSPGCSREARWSKGGARSERIGRP